MKRRCFAAVTALLMALGLTGCGDTKLKLNLNPQELYALPELPTQYTALNAQISALLAEGAEYAAPTSGTRVQSVQMVDLDSDGREEAIAFLRRYEDEKPLKIYIFKEVDEEYRPAAVIEGSGSAISSINYSDLNSDGRTELVVGWKVNTELQALSVYALRTGSGEELLRPEEVLKSVSYVKYAITDLDQDSLQEVVILRADEEGSGLAEYYSWGQSGSLAQSATAVSMTMAELSRQGRLTRGTLNDGTPALFITGVTEQSRCITDILTLEKGELDNILLSASTGVSRVISDYYGLYPTDINADGVTEVPVPVPLPKWSEEGDDYYRVDWMQFGPEGAGQTLLRTYHDMESRWSFQLPQEWTDAIMVSRTTMSDEAGVTFYRMERDSVPVPFLRISAITGTNRDIKALRGNRFILSRQMETSYTAELLEGNSRWGETALTPDQVRSAFSIIATEWTAGD
jgi:hypothetical protein